MNWVHGVRQTLLGLNIRICTTPLFEIVCGTTKTQTPLSSFASAVHIGDSRTESAKKMLAGGLDIEEPCAHCPPD